MGGGGRTKTPRLAARYATEFNLPFAPVGAFVKQCDRVRTACDDLGRTDPMIYSAALVACIGRDEAEVTRRAASIGREVDDLRANGVAGTVEEAATTLRTWIEAGAERIYLQILDVDDLDHLDLIAEEVAPLI